MESLAEQTWDVILHGTGLQQSLLALALSRSGKQILHLDPNEYYGGPEAAFSLQEVEEWAAAHAAADDGGPGRVFSSATVTKPEIAAGSGPSLSFPRAYSLALAPQIIHTRSELVKQLVSSRAFRQIEFLAVGSFFIYTPAPSGSADEKPSIVPIPSNREAVFSTTAIPAKAKRSLMKFLKFVLDYNAEEQRAMWAPHADKPLSEFLASDFKLDPALQTYIVTLTLSLDGKIGTKDGLAAIHRHLSSMGAFGPGFAAVYPKWGGLSEIAQVGCRACAVGGAVYMLGTGVKATRLLDVQEDGARFELDLTSDITVKSRTLIRGAEHVTSSSQRVSRLTAVVNSPLSSLFQAVVEGSPTPAVAVIAFPAASITDVASPNPIYVFAHSSETGECPSGQSVLYFVTPEASGSAEALEKALASLLPALGDGDGQPQAIYKVAYQQAKAAPSASADASDVLPSLPFDLAFSDTALEPVREAWTNVMGPVADDPDIEYMKFEDREGVDDDEDSYE
ncbi:rab protein geranylgeranyltransferase component A [Colletotrichum higginsianum]|uniref:Rab proteins geranylgeranyltransferase n=2 Tax=Colletotrichum higginsianum TaxID=80884 RepID=H1VPN4_COLHI|nr:Rab protein geranylgeranyltransferase component A [Colletotrichum higginsianum IMI 349063]OBR08551.1 Rab protein geranylgeranyltransferase component A [Colletotrichum higginsianum IMI 349063]TIC95111.1 Rab proteins geranylgeranyltransferase component A [Colletotrichum higginsianum]CCF42190.1 rab protein geranylgeranyltransferase component A [Colletotrichum higginsianum]